MLRMFVQQDDRIGHQQVSSLMASHIAPVTRRLPASGPLVFGRGIECRLTVDEDGFSGISPYLFGLILEHYLARHVAINTFVQTRLHSMQRGEVALWPVRMGQRGGV
jgi:type VI secretion system protein ImpG